MIKTRELPNGVRTLFRCKCGWYRDIGNCGREAWSTTLIQHPLYGTVSNSKAAIEDVLRHRCQFYLTRETKLKMIGDELGPNGN